MPNHNQNQAKHHTSHPKAKPIYTRNIENVEAGTRLSAMALYDKDENEYLLLDNKETKLVLTYPTLNNKHVLNEIQKIEKVLEEIPSLYCYLVTNEPVYTQTRLLANTQLNRFKVLSDFKNREYAKQTGTYIYELGALVKSIFVLDYAGRVLYNRYYEDLNVPINTDALLSDLKNVLEP